MKEIQESHATKLELKIRRNNILEDSFDEIKKIKLGRPSKKKKLRNFGHMSNHT